MLLMPSNPCAEQSDIMKDLGFVLTDTNLVGYSIWYHSAIANVQIELFDSIKNKSTIIIKILQTAIQFGKDQRISEFKSVLNM